MDAKMQSQVGKERLPLGTSIPLRSPLVVYVEPSGYCNLKCKFCPQGLAGRSLKKDLMTMDVFERLAEDMAGFPDPIRLLRVCGNGEPLINKELPEMLRLATRHRIAQRIDVVTNGLLLDDEMIRLLPRYASRIICSIEGLSSDDYQRICGVRVDYQEFLSKLDALYSNRGSCTIHIKIHHEAVKTEAEERRFFEAFGARCDEIFIERLVPMWPQLDVQFSSTRFRWGDEAIIDRRVCAQLFKGVQVQADGVVVPCCVDWKRVNTLGNIRAEGLCAIWKGDKLRALQMNHLAGKKSGIEPCRDCRMNDYCDLDNIDAQARECLDRLDARG